MAQNLTNGTPYTNETRACTTANDPNVQNQINTAFSCPNGINQTAQINNFIVYDATGLAILQTFALPLTDMLILYNTPRGTVTVNGISRLQNFTSFTTGLVQSLTGRLLEMSKDIVTGNLSNTHIQDTNKIPVFDITSTLPNATTKNAQISVRQGNTIRDIAQELRSQTYFLANTGQCNYIDFSCK